MRSGRAAVDELVVHVAAVAREQGQTGSAAPQDRDRGVGDRDGHEEGQCRPRGDAAVGVECARARERECGADQVRARVAEVDAGGRAVEDEEPAERAGEPEGERPRPGADEREPERGDRGHPARETVEAVEEVHGVEQADHRGRGDHVPEPAGDRGHDPGGDRADHDLAREADARVEVREVVGEPEEHREPERDEEAGPARVRDECGGEPAEHGDAAEVGDGDLLHLQGTRPVDDAGPQCDADRDRREYEGGREREESADERVHGAVRTRTTDSVPACTSMRAASTNPVAR